MTELQKLENIDPREFLSFIISELKKEHSEITTDEKAHCSNIFFKEHDNILHLFSTVKEETKERRTYHYNIIHDFLDNDFLKRFFKMKSIKNHIYHHIAFDFHQEDFMNRFISMKRKNKIKNILEDNE